MLYYSKCDIGYYANISIKTDFDWPFVWNTCSSISFVPKTPINNSAFVVVVFRGFVVAQFNLFNNKALIFHAP